METKLLYSNVGMHIYFYSSIERQIATLYAIQDMV